MYTCGNGILTYQATFACSLNITAETKTMQTLQGSPYLSQLEAAYSVERRGVFAQNTQPLKCSPAWKPSLGKHKVWFTD